MVPLVFRCRDHFTSAGHTMNEDVAGWNPMAAWVLDGASTPASLDATGPTPARRYADMLSCAIAEVSEKDFGLAASEILGRAIETVGRPPSAFGLPNIASEPSCVGAVITVHDIGLAFAILGDVEILYYSCATRLAHVISDQRALIREQRYQKMLGESVKSGMSLSAARDVVWAEEIRARREDMNRPGGYWSISGAIEAASHCVTGKIRPTVGDLVLIASDGFTRISRMFALATPSELIQTLGSGYHLSAWGERLRAAERSPASLSTHPRMTLSDDATAILLEMQSGETDVQNE